MELSLLLTLLFFLFIDLHAQKFEEESPFMPIRLMDVKIFEWKPDSLQKMERALDSELKYTDEKKGTACKTIRFEQEAGYPKQDARFLDLSVRGICTTEEGKDVPIEKDLITKAIIQKKEAVNAAVHGHVFSSGNVRFYERDRNKLNLIIIPASVGFVTLLFILTFFLRRMRAHQKREHIISELQKKRELTQKKSQNLTMTMPNIDPFANDKQRLLQLDPTVVGNVSHTTGSSKQFTNEQYVSRKSNHVPPVTTATTMNDQRTYNRTQQQQHDDDDVPPPIPPKDNRAPYYKREEENPFASQRPVKTSHERMYVPFENDTRYSPTHGQHHDMMPLQEKQPRVIVRSIRDDENYPPFYQQQTNFDDSTPTFVSIPVQIEHSGSHQRFSSPYHSDPYYPHINS